MSRRVDLRRLITIFGGVKPMSSNQQFRVTANGLNIRAEPVLAPRTLKATLPQGQLVTKLTVASDERWWNVRMDLHAKHLEGFVDHNFLAPVAAFSQPPPQQGIKEVHLQTNKRIARDQTSGRAFPLNEAGAPRRDATTAAGKAGQLAGIINWLKVEQSARYRATSGTTFCNIYAYDYCYLAGVFLPRVWWTRKAIATLASGGQVSAQYDVTVTELNANSLYTWFEEFGTDFGWTRTFDMTDLQNAANAGKICIINGERTDLNRPGHICAVVAEAQGHTAVRNDSTVTTPLQSQAGASNFQ